MLWVLLVSYFSSSLFAQEISNAIWFLNNANTTLQFETKPARICQEHEGTMMATGYRSVVAVDPNQFCDYPYDTICGNLNKTKSRDRESRISPMKEKIKKEALRGTAMELQMDPDKFTEKELKDETSIGVRRNLIYLKKLANAQTVFTSNIEKNSAISAFYQARSALQESIQASPLTVSQRNYLVGMVQAVRVVLTNDPSLEMDLNLLQNIRSMCGDDGMKDNAFATKDKNHRPVIVLCPGTIIAGSSGKNSGQEKSLQEWQDNIFNLIQTIGHEIGHHFDGNKYPTIYQKLHACFVKQSPNEIVRINKHWKEITADYWGTQTVRAYLNYKTPQEKLRLIQETMAGYCGSTDGETHPGDRFRIEVLLRNDPGLWKKMGCTGPLKDKPVCTLEGDTYK